MDKTNVVSIKKNQRDSFEGILKAYREEITKINAVDNLQIIDLKKSNIFHITLRKNIINIAFDNLPEADKSYSCTLILKQDTLGARKVVFPENVLWSYGEVAVLATKPNHADVITLMTFDGGETFFASHALANLGK
jgi:hypothetical protein